MRATVLCWFVWCGTLFAQVPNIVVITAGNAGDLDRYRSKSNALTTHMDALAGQGMVCSDAHAAGLTEISSLYGLLTGEFPFRSGSTMGSAGKVTIPQMLQPLGFTTGMIGFWPMAVDPVAWGFEYKEHVQAEPEGARITQAAVQFIQASETPFFLYLSYPAAGAVNAAELDHQVGQLSDALRQSGREENTLVILTALTGSAKQAADDAHGKRGDLQESGHRVPFIARWPRYIKPGAEYGGIVCLTDLMATFARLSKYALPADVGGDSFDLIPVMIGRHPPNKPIRPSLVIQSKSSGRFMIRMGDAKLIMPTEQTGGELYNLAADAPEQQNLYKAHPRTVDMLSLKLQEIIASSGTRFKGGSEDQGTKPVRFVNKRKYPVKEEGDPLKPYKGPSIPGIDNKSIKGKVMVGYQGWFNCKGDGAGLDWTHWGRGKKFTPRDITVDLWPDVSEYPEKDLFETVFKHEDGSSGRVFSSYKKSTQILHFEWMKTYGIHGAFLQRFAHGLVREERAHHKNVVLANVREAANRTGCTYAMMYDLSGLKKGGTSIIIDDWKMLQSKMKITSDPAYQHHRGKPLVSLWGLGFNSNSKPREYTLPECRDLIQFFKDQGCSVKIGVPTGWRTLDRDSLASSEVHELIQMADVISPWTPGRYRTLEGVRAHGETRWKPDVEWLTPRGIDYIPVLFPGFSWHNNKGDALNAIPRLKGEFLWEQVKAAKESGCEMLYIAMFDEVDEGTAIFKCTNTPPTGNGGVFATYEGLPSDFYLRLAGLAGRIIRNEVPMSKSLNTYDEVLLKESR